MQSNNISTAVQFRIQIILSSLLRLKVDHHVANRSRSRRLQHWYKAKAKAFHIYLINMLQSTKKRIYTDRESL